MPTMPSGHISLDSPGPDNRPAEQSVPLVGTEVHGYSSAGPGRTRVCDLRDVGAFSLPASYLYEIMEVTHGQHNDVPSLWAHSTAAQFTRQS